MSARLSNTKRCMVLHPLATFTNYGPERHGVRCTQLLDRHGPDHIGYTNGWQVMRWRWNEQETKP